MGFLETIQSAAESLDLLDWWLIGFVVAGLIVGISSGYFRARRIQPRGFKWKFFRHEIMWTIINLFVSAFTLGAMKAFLQGNGYIAFNPEPASAWVIAFEFAIYFFLFDTWFYWLHRLMHIEPIYKWAHKTHHVSTSTNPLTSTSVNPIEAFINGAFTPIFTASATLLATYVPGMSPIHTAAAALIFPSNILMGLYVHSGFEFLPRWWNRSWLTKWFISATFHDQHHRYFIGNFGGYTTIWDRLCGTMRKNFESDFAKVTTRPVEGFSRKQSGKKVAA